MSGRFFIFDKGFNKILDLLSDYEPKIANIYGNFVNGLPYAITDETYKLEEFSLPENNYFAEMCVMENSIWLDVVNNKPYMRFELYVHRLYEENLSEENSHFRLFKFGYRNTVDKRPDIQFNYREENGKYVFVGTNDNPHEIINDKYYEVLLERRGDDYYLISIGNNRGIEFYRNELKLSFYDLVEYIEDEDEYEEDFDIEFDADFDL